MPVCVSRITPQIILTCIAFLDTIEASPINGLKTHSTHHSDQIEIRCETVPIEFPVEATNSTSRQTKDPRLARRENDNR